MARSVSVPTGAFVVAYEWLEQSHDGDDSNFYGDEFLEDVTCRAEELFPSLRECNEWLGREDRAILENSFAYFGVSEYCGLVSIWMVLKDQDDHNVHLAEHWAAQVSTKFKEVFGTLTKVGTFSNGEAIFEKKGKMNGKA